MRRKIVLKSTFVGFRTRSTRNWRWARSHARFTGSGHFAVFLGRLLSRQRLWLLSRVRLFGGVARRGRRHFSWRLNSRLTLLFRLGRGRCGLFGLGFWGGFRRSVLGHGSRSDWGRCRRGSRRPRRRGRRGGRSGGGHGGHILAGEHVPVGVRVDDANGARPWPPRSASTFTRLASRWQTHARHRNGGHGHWLRRLLGSRRLLILLGRLLGLVGLLLLLEVNGCKHEITLAILFGLRVKELGKVKIRRSKYKSTASQHVKATSTGYLLHKQVPFALSAAKL